MRIIAGELKGREVPIPGTDLVRPTADRTKAAIFSILESRIHLQGRTVLDLYAGSGNLGFEALSRGCANCLFVDSNPEHIRCIEKTAGTFGLLPRTRFRCAEADTFLGSCASSFDLIFADPPYEDPLIPDLPDLIFDKGLLEPEGFLIVEHDRRISFEAVEKCVLSRPYGRTVVSVFQDVGAEESPL